MSGNGAGPSFDVIVVGGGHNALTAAYLQRAGLPACSRRATSSVARA